MMMEVIGEEEGEESLKGMGRYNDAYELTTLLFRGIYRQVIENYRRGSVEGLSINFLSIWLAGKMTD